MPKITRALLCALLLICGLSAQSAPLLIKIVGAAPLTGDQAASNIPIRNGVVLAVEEARSRFAKLGIKLIYIDADDQGSEDVGVSIAQRVAADPSVLSVVGHVNSSVSLRAMLVYARSNNLLMRACGSRLGCRRARPVRSAAATSRRSPPRACR